MSFLLHILLFFKSKMHAMDEMMQLMTNSNSLVHKMRIVKCFNFHHTKAIGYSPHAQSVKLQFLTSFR